MVSTTVPRGLKENLRNARKLQRKAAQRELSADVGYRKVQSRSKQAIFPVLSSLCLLIKSFNFCTHLVT